jgi:hypothetical protein
VAADRTCPPVLVELGVGTDGGLVGALSLSSGSSAPADCAISLLGVGRSAPVCRALRGAAAHPAVTWLSVVAEVEAGTADVVLGKIRTSSATPSSDQQGEGVWERQARRASRLLKPGGKQAQYATLLSAPSTEIALSLVAAQSAASSSLAGSQS